MPTYTVEGPDGRRYKVQGPANATPEQLAAVIQSQGLQPQDKGLGERLRDTSMQMSGGMVEPLLSMASSGLGEVAGGLTGLGTFALTGGDIDAARHVQDATADALTYRPRTAGGQAATQVIGAPAAPAATGNLLAARKLGDAAYRSGGPVAGALASTLPTAASMVAGGVMNRAVNAGGAPPRLPPAETRPALLPPEPGREVARLDGLPGPLREVGEDIAAGSTDGKTAPYRLDDWRGVSKDKLQQEAVKQGVDKSVVAAIREATPETRAQMLAMLRKMRDIRDNKLKAAEPDARPGAVAGDALTQRVRHILKVNSEAGKQVNRVAKSLKGEVVDYAPAVQSFRDDLADMGVQFGDDLQPVFKGSDIEGATAAENFISKIVARMRDTDTPSAYDVHRLKKYIDEQVSYGKAGEGLTGKSERVVKKLRARLDRALDEQFPEYNEANTTYADTIGALDALQSIAGKRIDLAGDSAGDALGTLLRRLTSNAQSRVPLSDAMAQVESVARKYGGQFNDDIRAQAIFANELDRVFGPVADTSLNAEVGKGVARGALDLATGQPNAAVTMASEGILTKVGNKLQGVSTDNAYKALEKLLEAE